MERKRITDTVRIDGEKLKQAIADHNLIGTELSEKIGYTKAYLSRFTSGAVEEMPTRVATLLDLCGIHLDEYKYEEPEHPMRIDPEDDSLPWDIEQFADKLIAAPSTVVLSSESITELCNAMHGIIYDAVYNAVDKAMREVLL